MQRSGLQIVEASYDGWAVLLLLRTASTASSLWRATTDDWECDEFWIKKRTVDSLFLGPSQVSYIKISEYQRKCRLPRKKKPLPTEKPVSCKSSTHRYPPNHRPPSYPTAGAIIRSAIIFAISSSPPPFGFIRVYSSPGSSTTNSTLTFFSPRSSSLTAAGTSSREMPAASSTISLATFMPIKALVSIVEMKLSMPEV